MNYVKRIRDIREDKDLKQSDIAKILGIKQQQYSRIETGERELHIEHGTRIKKTCAKIFCFIFGTLSHFGTMAPNLPSRSKQIWC